MESFDSFNNKECAYMMSYFVYFDPRLLYFHIPSLLILLAVRYNG